MFLVGRVKRRISRQKLAGYTMNKTAKNSASLVVTAILTALCFSWTFVLAPSTWAMSQKAPQPPKPHSAWMSDREKEALALQVAKVKAMRRHAQRPGYPYLQAMKRRAAQPERLANRISA